MPEPPTQAELDARRAAYEALPDETWEVESEWNTIWATDAFGFPRVAHGARTRRGGEIEPWGIRSRRREYRAIGNSRSLCEGRRSRRKRRSRW